MQQLLYGPPAVGPDGKPVDKNAAIKKLTDDFTTASQKIEDQQNKINKTFEGDDSGDSGASDSGVQDIAHDPKTGKMYRYKGTGDRGDMNNYIQLN